MDYGEITENDSNLEVPGRPNILQFNTEQFTYTTAAPQPFFIVTKAFTDHRENP